MDFSWERKVAALGGKKAPQKDRKDKRQEGAAPAALAHPSCKGTGRMRTWGQECAAPAFFGTNLEVLGVSGPL